MSKTHNAGIVTAYGAAVRGGYTGTYEEFCAQQAQYAENARQMEQAVSDVRDIKTSVESAVSVAEAHANDAEQSATNASNSATQASQSASNASQSANNASSSADSASQSATSAQTSATNASTSEQNARQSAEDAQDILDSVQAEGNTQIGRVQAKGQEVLDSLPEDFTQVQKDIDSLNGSLSTLSTLSAFMNTVPVDTASGAIATFADGADDIPVKNLTVKIDPVQSGTGDPSPDNIRPISGWTGTTLTCNNDIINIDWTDEAGTVYSGTLDVTNGKLTVDMAMVDLGTLKWYYFARTNPPHFGADVSGMEPQTSNLLCSNYATVKNNPNSNAYGTIRATSEHSSNGIKISDTAYTDTNSFKAAMSGVQLVYELANPITYQLTPQEVKTILGENNIFADTGDISVEYRADIKKYIDKVVATAISALS